MRTLPATSHHFITIGLSVLGCEKMQPNLRSQRVGWVDAVNPTFHDPIMQYRRDYTQGATYFFTVVAFRRILSAIPGGL